MIEKTVTRKEVTTKLDNTSVSRLRLKDNKGNLQNSITCGCKFPNVEYTGWVGRSNECHPLQSGWK